MLESLSNIKETTFRDNEPVDSSRISKLGTCPLNIPTANGKSDKSI